MTTVQIALGALMTVIFLAASNSLAASFVPQQVQRVL
jgi:hypothetical protein